MVVNILSWPVAAFIYLLAYLMSLLIWFDSERCEYLADCLGAQVSGTDAMISRRDIMCLDDAFRGRLVRGYHDGHRGDFFGELRDRLRNAPEREVLRQRRLIDAARRDLLLSHPSDAQRIECLRAQPYVAPKVTFSEGEMARLRKELAPLFKSQQELMFALDDESFRAFFGVTW